MPVPTTDHTARPDPAHCTRPFSTGPRNGACDKDRPGPHEEKKTTTNYTITAAGCDKGPDLKCSQPLAKRNIFFSFPPLFAPPNVAHAGILLNANILSALINI